MSKTLRMILTTLLCFAVLGISVDAHAENQRRQWVKKFDDNKDHRLKGKEAKNFMKAHPKQHSQLVRWCDKASEKPKKEGVSFPKGVKEKKFKCKKKRIDAPYVKAWVAKGQKKNPCGSERDNARGEGSTNRQEPVADEPDQPCNPCNPCQ